MSWGGDKRKHMMSVIDTVISERSHLLIRAQLIQILPVFVLIPTVIIVSTKNIHL